MGYVCKFASFLCQFLFFFHLFYIFVVWPFSLDIQFSSVTFLYFFLKIRYKRISYDVLMKLGPVTTLD